MTHNPIKDYKRHHARFIVLAIAVCAALAIIGTIIGISAYQRAHAANITSGSITITVTPGTVERGQKAYVGISGKPNTHYTCTVTYSSGNSEAAGLGDSTSDSSGKADWGWRIGTHTAIGKWPVTITDGTDSTTTYVEVE